MPIVCRKCGSIDDYWTKQVTNNLVATCISCGAYIQNIAYDVPKMYVGKFKGMDIKSINDIGYLKWAHENMNSLTRRQKDAVHEQIIRLENLLR